MFGISMSSFRYGLFSVAGVAMDAGTAICSDKGSHPCDKPEFYWPMYLAGTGLAMVGLVLTLKTVMTDGGCYDPNAVDEDEAAAELPQLQA
jgi:hypothetical protein